MIKVFCIEKLGPQGIASNTQKQISNRDY